MSLIIARGRIRIGTLCFGMFLLCSLPSYGAPSQQPVVSDKKDSSAVSLSTGQPLGETPLKGSKKKVPKEGVKDAHVGPPPINAPIKRKFTKRLSTVHRNPVDISTGKELIPVIENSTK